MGLGIFSTLLAILALLLVAAAVSDIKSREIPHWVVIAMAALAPAFWWACGYELWPDVALTLGAALILFALFTAAFAFGWMGGGDVKLLGALALWLPLRDIMPMLVIMSLAGGVLTLVLVVWTKLRRTETAGGNLEIPYGVAIAFAGLWLSGERLINQFG